MELAFAEKSLREICESEACARRELGVRVAEVLKHRLADMDAATSVRDLVPGSPRVVGGADSELMAVDLCDGHTLVFAANHVRNPRTAADELDWGRVSRVKLLRIEGAHG